VDQKTLSVEALAALSRLSVRTVYGWLKASIIPGITPGGAYARYGPFSMRTLAYFLLGRQLRSDGYNVLQVKDALHVVAEGWDGQGVNQAGLLLGLRDGFKWASELTMRIDQMEYSLTGLGWPNVWGITRLAEQAMLAADEWQEQQETADDSEPTAAT